MNKPNQYLVSYAESIVNNPLKDEITDRIYTDLVQRFRLATDSERVEIVKIMDSLDLFLQECEKIVAEGKHVYQEEEE